MRKFLFLLILTAMTGTAFASDKAANETYDRVAKTRTLRCAYTIYPPFFLKDPNTGAFSGISHDIFEEIGKQLGIKIEWAEEVSPDAIFEGFKTGRYDAVCIGYAETPSRAWGGDFSKPFMYVPFYMYVRARETRFKSLEDFNSKDVKLSTLDGEMSQMVTRQDYPLAKEMSLPGLTPPGDRLEMVASGKADGTGMEPDIAEAYMAKNPGKIMRFGDKPLRMQGCTAVIPHNEFELKEMLDTAIDAVTWTGALEKLVKKHETYPGTILLPAQPYRQPEATK